jgi:hypothetical protein
MLFKKILILFFLLNFSNNYAFSWRAVRIISASSIPGAVAGGIIGCTVLRPAFPSVAEGVIISAVIGSWVNVITVACIYLHQGCCTKGDVPSHCQVL